MATVIRGSDNFDTSTATTTADVYSAISSREAYANFVTSNIGGFTIGTQGNGTHIPFTYVSSQKNITGNTAANTWTHSLTGKYLLRIRYRQNTGGDIWTVWGVTKDGNNNAVGVSARTGSEDAHNEEYTIFYTVDSTSSSYQLQGWAGTSTRTVIDAGSSQGKPSWANYDTLVNETDVNAGKTLDIIISRLGD